MTRAPKICVENHIRAGLSGYVASLSSAMLGAELGLPVRVPRKHRSFACRPPSCPRPTPGSARLWHGDSRARAPAGW